MNTARHEFIQGFKAELPILVGVIPFGLIYGVSAINAGIPALAAQAMSVIVLAGSAQFVMTKLIGTGVPVSVTIITAFIVNLRHLLYSASIAPYLKPLKTRWKWLLAYFLTDEAYAVSITHYQLPSEQTSKHWYFLGAGMALFSAWQISTAIGILLGAQLPASWSLDFAIALTFIALVVPMLKDRPGIVSAVVASIVAIGAAGVPYKLDLIIATFVGMLVGLGIEKVH